jgi:hypothetical protein
MIQEERRDSKRERPVKTATMVMRSLKAATPTVATDARPASLKMEAA